MYTYKLETITAEGVSGTKYGKGGWDKETAYLRMMSAIRATNKIEGLTASAKVVQEGEAN